MIVKLGTKEVEIDVVDETAMIIKTDRVTVMIRESEEGIAFRSYDPEHKMRVGDTNFFHLGKPVEDRPDLREIVWEYKDGTR